MKPSLDDIALFSAVAGAGSFAAAARRLSMPTSTVSRRVAALEDALGTQLILRTTRHFSLTEDGRAFADRCRSALDEIEAASAALEPRDGGLRGNLRVTAPAYICPDMFGTWLLEFAGQHPALSLELRLTNVEPDLVEEGIDLSFQVGPLRDQQHIARKMWTFRYTLCASRRLLETESQLGALRHPRDLAEVPCVVTPPLDRWRFERKADEAFTFVPSRRAATSDDWRVGATAVRMGMGVGYLPDVLIEADLGRDLVALDLDGWQPISRDLYAVYPMSRQLSPKVRAAIDFALGGRALHDPR
jgi:DNA-binding transcriptional LysR family regulator